MFWVVGCDLTHKSITAGDGIRKLTKVKDYLLFRSEEIVQRCMSSGSPEKKNSIAF